jgi:hypothetical protein
MKSRGRVSRVFGQPVLIISVVQRFGTGPEQTLRTETLEGFILMPFRSHELRVFGWVIGLVSIIDLESL